MFTFIMVFLFVMAICACVNMYKSEQQEKKMHEAIMNGDVQTLYHMLNRLENDGTIKRDFGKEWRSC